MESLLPGSSLGRYQVLEQLGRGGMASVFRALDPHLERDVAIKVLPTYVSESKTLVERFWQEARAVARLAHPNIITIHDFGEDKGFTYIVMEYVAGGTLTDRMGRRFSIEETLSYMSPLAEALAYAHRQGVVHRDIKPANILLDEESSPKLSDFGIARMLEGGGLLTSPGSVPGTPEYVSPEQVLGRRADGRSDNYAFGIVVYQMFLGRTPFHAETPTTALMAHVHQEVPLPRKLDPNMEPRLEPILLKALHKDPDRRFQTAVDMTDAMAALSPRPSGYDSTRDMPTIAEEAEPVALPEPAEEVGPDKEVVALRGDRWQGGAADPRSESESGADSQDSGPVYGGFLRTRRRDHVRSGHAGRSGQPGTSGTHEGVGVQGARAVATGGAGVCVSAKADRARARRRAQIERGDREAPGPV